MSSGINRLIQVKELKSQNANEEMSAEADSKRPRAEKKSLANIQRPFDEMAKGKAGTGKDIGQAKPERHYREAVKLFPSDVDSLTNLGEILLKTKRLPEGVELLKTAVNLDPAGNHPSGNRARLLLNGLQDKDHHSPGSR